MLGPQYLLHDHILGAAEEGSLCFDDGLEELEVLDVAAMCLDAVNEVLDHTFRHLTAQMGVIFEHSTDGLGLKQLQ